MRPAPERRRQATASARRRGRQSPLAALFVVLVAALLGSCSGSGTDDEPRHLVLITVDTWRADHAFTEVAGVALTPNLDRLAATAVRYSAASSVAAATSAGVAGILTGLYPQRSGVVVNDHMVPSSLPTLATRLDEAGFRSAAFIANPVLAPGFGFENGFGHYELVRRSGARRKARAEEVNQRVLEWLEKHPPQNRERLLLWVHYMEPHGPYEPPQEVQDLFTIDAFGAESDVPLLDPGRHDGRGGIPGYQRYGKPPITDARDYQLRYAAEVRALDAALGELLDELTEAGILDRSVLVLAADHGEALAGDHGFYFSHDNGMTRDQVGVPLLLRYPGCETGTVVDRAVSNVDVLPTLLELLGLAAEGEFDGFSLLAARPEPVVSQSGREIAVRDGDWKLRWRRRSGPRLFDLGSDPGETADVSETHAQRLLDLRNFVGRVRNRPALAPSVRRETLTREQRQELRSLGYL